MFAVMLPVLLAAIGVAVDYSRARRLQSDMQSALDAAVLAGAQAPSGTQITRAAAVFGNDLTNTSAGTVTPTFTVAADGSVSGTASADLQTTISAILHVSRMTVSVAATAVMKTVTTTTPGSGTDVCILVLAPNASQALLLNSGADLAAPLCEIHVKSTASPAVIFNAGTTLQTAKTCIQGNNVIDNGGIHPGVQLGCQTINDPFAGNLPAPPSTSCQYANLNFNGGTVNLTPGVYCGWINFNGAPTVNFAPGVYVIRDGGWNVNGGVWTGDDVTFYFADTSKIQFNSGVSSRLHAPLSGTYKGILIYEPNGLPNSQFVLDDSPGSDLQGLIYLPSRDTIFNSTSAVSSEALSIVVNTLILNRTIWDLAPTDQMVSGTSTVTATTQTPVLVH